MKRPSTKKNGQPRLCNRQYRKWVRIRWSRFYNCRKPTGHPGPCGTENIS